MKKIILMLLFSISVNAQSLLFYGESSGLANQLYTSDGKEFLTSDSQKVIVQAVPLAMLTKDLINEYFAEFYKKEEEDEENNSYNNII